MNKRILNLAIPNIISNLSVPLLGIVDLALMGYKGSLQDMGAIALGGMIFNFIYWLWGFLRMGTTGFTAQSWGRRDLPAVVMHLSKALLVALASSLLLIILQTPIARLSFWVVEGSAEVERLAQVYFFIRIWAAPATISLYALTGWFVGMQNTKTPMVITIVINLLNIAFNMLFVFGFGMRSEGVAWGTVLAQYSGLLLALFFLLRHYGKLKKYVTLKGILQLRAFFNLNIHLFIRTLLLILTLSYFTIASARFGDTILAVNTLLLQFFTIFSYFLDGFAYSAEALTGKFIGSNNRKGLQQMLRIIFRWTAGLSLLFSLIYLFGHNLLLHILTNKTAVIDAAAPYLTWIIFIPLTTFPAFVWDGVFIGATASKSMRNVMAIATLCFFFPTWFLLQHTMGNHALWLAFLLMMSARSLFMTLIAKKVLLPPFQEHYKRS
ncbi:MAG: MATE family efflux transporter [Bacteroidetes bacterium]|nr:MAG: MATE family efflux transporter [Bacteroidota bacterium]